MICKFELPLSDDMRTLSAAAGTTSVNIFAEFRRTWFKSHAPDPSNKSQCDVGYYYIIFEMRRPSSPSVGHNDNNWRICGQYNNDKLSALFLTRLTLTLLVVN